jgi:hypothetical protein
MDVHPPTHVQLEIPMVDMYDKLHLSVVQNFKSIGNHLHIGIILKQQQQQQCLGYGATKP